jgi:tRNA(fMet)-specific endonuclease VapC
MNRALIDTDILTYFLKGDPEVIQNLNNYLDYYDVLEINLISYYEILSGLSAKNAFKQISIFEDFVSENIILPLTEKSVKISAEIYGTLRKSGNKLDDIDVLIAGIAIENDMTLITNNVKHFSRIPGLKIENWKKQTHM